MAQSTRRCEQKKANRLLSKHPVEWRNFPQKNFCVSTLPALEGWRESLENMLWWAQKSPRATITSTNKKKGLVDIRLSLCLSCTPFTVTLETEWVCAAGHATTLKPFTSKARISLIIYSAWQIVFQPDRTCLIDSLSEQMIYGKNYVSTWTIVIDIHCLRWRCAIKSQTFLFKTLSVDTRLD